MSKKALTIDETDIFQLWHPPLDTRAVLLLFAPAWTFGPALLIFKEF